MYSWGPSTRDWKKPGAYNFDSARAPYLNSLASASSAKGGRSYSLRREPDATLTLAKKAISSDSENVIVVGVDVTGSMDTWPGEIFDRLPLFYQTLSQYRPDVEMSFNAIGDASCDRWPLQVTDFGKGVSLEENLRALGCEGGGGGQVSESYELFGHYMNTKCSTPKALSPFLFIFGDEKFYPQVEPEQVKHYIGDTLEKRLKSEEVWNSLNRKFNLFYLHKPYGSGGDSRITKEVGDYWKAAIGPQHVIELPSSERAVDVAIAIVAKTWGQYGDFKKSMLARHDPGDVAPVDYSIRMVARGDPSLRASRMLIDGTNSKQSMDLDT
jgi:hypothetical protein